MRNFTANLLGSTGSSLATSWFPVSEMAKFSAICSVVNDGAAAGTVTFQVANETSTGGGSMMSFTPSVSVSLAAPTFTVAGNTTQISSVTDISYQWMRIVYTRSAGSGGTISVQVSGHD
jgi:hypothetical protein